MRVMFQTHLYSNGTKLHYSQMVSSFILVRHTKFSRQWRFRSWSSGLWCLAVM